MERIKLSNATALQVVSFSASGVNDLSEEDFEKNFEAMMVQTPEEFDAAQQQPEEIQLIESPVAEETPNEVPEEEPEVQLEQPQEQLDEAPVTEPTAVEQPEPGVTEDPVVEDSPTEPVEFDFSSIPRDKVIPNDIQVNGMTVRATMEELEVGFKKGMNYTQKMQEIAPHRKDMNIMMENGLTTDDLNLLIEAKGGNKDALGKLLAKAEVDPLDLDTENKAEYIPKDYAKDVPNVEMEQIKAEILQDNEFSPQVENALQTMPDDMYTMVSGGSGQMSALYKDVKSGLYAQAMPEVMKQQALYGKTEPTIDTYLRVAGQFMKPETPKEVVPPAANNAELNNKRRSAASTPKSTPPKRDSFIQEDLNEMNDDDFEKAFEKMIGRSVSDFNS